MNVNSSRLFQLFKYTVYALSRDEHLLVLRGGACGRCAAVRRRRGFQQTSSKPMRRPWIRLPGSCCCSCLNSRPTCSRTGISPSQWSCTLHALAGALLRDVYLDAFSGTSTICCLSATRCHWRASATLCALTPGRMVMGGDARRIRCDHRSQLRHFVGRRQLPAVRDLPAIVDSAGSTAIVRLAWVDVINAIVWLLVVIVLEIDVRLQERNRYEGVALIASQAMKLVLYSTLLLAAVYWGCQRRFRRFLGRLSLACRFRLHRAQRVRVAPGGKRRAGGRDSSVEWRIASTRGPFRPMIRK